VFAPLANLGTIVLDEEHESSYKQADTPRYHARAVAVMRAKLQGGLCLLGSATPALESWENARRGRYALLELPERVTDHPLPEVRVIDLRAGRALAAEGEDRAADASAAEEKDRAEAASAAEEKDRARDGRIPGNLTLTPPLRHAIELRLQRGEQCILLLNRRGYATFVQCGHCGKVWSCPHCNVSLTFHRRKGALLCHHCAFQDSAPELCDECDSRIFYSGLGTEQVERHLGDAFPAARIVRMDLDTTSTKWSHLRIFERMLGQEVDILLGTQMIAKGLDFPHVTLVGVINADVGLNLPDFRASERTFQLLSQVAGRAGRGPEPGEVIVQTSRPSHFALLAAVRHDYGAFAERELAGDNRSLARFELTGIPRLPPSMARVEVTFQLDADALPPGLPPEFAMDATTRAPWSACSIRHSRRPTWAAPKSVRPSRFRRSASWPAARSRRGYTHAVPCPGRRP
jgi:primosomal protein N' (replication factor Y)